MDPSAALTSFENALRIAIRTVFGNRWLDAQGAPEQADLSRRYAEEVARRDGVNLSADLLEYAMTTDLTKLILRNWEAFKPVFSDKKRTETYFGVVEDVRNAIAHGREVLPHERDLVAGAAGQIRLQVSEHQSAADASTQYYPVIERITDHFGRGPDSRGYQHEMVYPRINVGDVLQFRAYASGGRGHAVRWYLNPSRANEDLQYPTGYRDDWGFDAEGNEVTLEYIVTAEDVMEHFWISINLRSDNIYHRETSGWDEYAVFKYAVNPPR